LRKELTLERILPTQLALFASHLSGRINLQLKNELMIDRRVLCPIRCHFLLTCLALPTK
jgi:hypothetical protein